MKTKTKVGIAIGGIGTVIGIIFIAIAVKVKDLGLFDRIGRIAVGAIIIVAALFIARLLTKKKPQPAPAPVKPAGPEIISPASADEPVEEVEAEVVGIASESDNPQVIDVKAE